MAKKPERYRLWEHDVEPPKKSEQTVIAKVDADAGGPIALSASSMSAGGRAARAAGVTPDSALARLLDNAHVASITNVFDEGPGAGTRSLSMFAAAGAGGRTAMARARAPRLVELKVSKGTSAAQLAAHVARMKDVEYAFVPPVRTVFGRRARTKADPLASRLWGHGAIRLGHARAAAGFKNATNITIAVVDTGIDPKHPDLKHAIVEYKNFRRASDKDFKGHGTHVAGIIAATAGNGLGISGVCGGKILALKAIQRDGEQFDAPAYYRALRYVIGKAKVLNLSIGGDKDLAEIDILRDVIASGVVVIAAMGNEHDEGNPTEYPAAMRGGLRGGRDRRTRQARRLLQHGPPHRSGGAGRRHPVHDADLYLRRRRAGVRRVGRHVDGHAARGRRGRAGAGQVARAVAGAGHQEADLVGRPRGRREERQRRLWRRPPQLREGAALSGRLGAGRAVKLIVKVDVSRSKDPTRHVRKVLRGAGEGGRVEEVFPGLRTGSSAGLVAVTLPDAPDTKARRATLKALRDDEAIAYVDTAKARRPKGRTVRL